jgi:hypothetical protein
MTAKTLKDVLRRVKTWPEEAQERLAEIARSKSTPEELEARDEAERSGLASDAEVEAAFDSFRRR